MKMRVIKKLYLQTVSILHISYINNKFCKFLNYVNVRVILIDYTFTVPKHFGHVLWFLFGIEIFQS